MGWGALPYSTPRFAFAFANPSSPSLAVLRWLTVVFVPAMVDDHSTVLLFQWWTIAVFLLPMFDDCRALCTGHGLDLPINTFSCTVGLKLSQANYYIKSSAAAAALCKEVHNIT